ncbi:MAG: hypothetical protein U0984_19645 [Prosthecobacter sp.]|nr:hypothetical protein [Prosthecobacter sp.]
MPASFSLPQRTYLPGTSLVLTADPTGPRLTTLATNSKQGAISYLVVWRDSTGARCEGEYASGDLMLPVGVIP